MLKQFSPKAVSIAYISEDDKKAAVIFPLCKAYPACSHQGFIVELYFWARNSVLIKELAVCSFFQSNFDQPWFTT
jgi:hypothetical protein